MDPGTLLSGAEQAMVFSILPLNDAYWTDLLAKLILERDAKKEEQKTLEVDVESKVIYSNNK